MQIERILHILMYLKSQPEQFSISIVRMKLFRKMNELPDRTESPN